MTTELVMLAVGSLVAWAVMMYLAVSDEQSSRHS